MAGKSGARQFSIEDKAAVLAVLAANGNNVKRTARECGVLPATVRRWRDQAAQGQGPPPEAMQEAVNDFLDVAERVRNKAIEEIERLIDAGEVNAATLNSIMGTLDDKIRLARGMPTSRTEHTAILPPREQLRELMAGFVEGAIKSAERRHEEIVDAEVVQEIPASTQAE